MRFPKYSDAAWMVGVLSGLVAGMASVTIGFLGGLLAGAALLLALVLLAPRAFVRRTVQKMLALLGFFTAYPLLHLAVLSTGTMQFLAIGGFVILCFGTNWLLSEFEQRG